MTLTLAAAALIASSDAPPTKRAVSLLVEHGWKGMTLSDAVEVLTAKGFRLADLEAISLDDALEAARLIRRTA